MNCQGSHAAFSKNCPKWLEEKEVQRLKHTLGISFPEARKRLQPTVPVQQSYASVAQPVKQVSVRSMAVQTDLTWPKSSSTPKTLSSSTGSSKQTNASSQTVKSTDNRDSSSQKKSESHRSRSVSKDKREPKCSSSDSVPTRSRFSGLDVDDEEEEDMEEEVPVPPQRPCPLSKKGNKGGVKKSAPT